MRSSSTNRFVFLLLCGASAALAQADDRTADAILAEIQATRPTDLTQRAALIGDLARSYPDRPELAKLLAERWQTLMITAKDGIEITKREVDAVIATSKDESLVAEAAFRNLMIELWKPSPDGINESLTTAFGAFTQRFPKDERAAMVLSAMVGRTNDESLKATLNQRIIRDYPESTAGQALINARRQVEGLGKPFAIDFEDAIRATRVNSASLKGKVVVIDFWATWCKPCVAEMPELKALYARFKDQGVEFVGVTLDIPREQGGFDNLKRFVEKEGVAWPQYYEGTPNATDFALTWGVQAIPIVFVLDAEGRLFSADARGKLATIITQALAKSKKP